MKQEIKEEIKIVVAMFRENIGLYSFVSVFLVWMFWAFDHDVAIVSRNTGEEIGIWFFLLLLFGIYLSVIIAVKVYTFISSKV